MIELLKGVDTWFLLLALAGLAAWFVWSIKKLFGGLEQSIKELHDLIEKLFSKNDNHESRLSALEGRCQAMSCEHEGAHRRIGNGP